MKEEIIFTGFDTGWQKDMPVKLITYDDGSMDVHRQTGPQFKEHIAEARKVLNARGFDFNPDKIEGYYCTGAYFTVTKIGDV